MKKYMKLKLIEKEIKSDYQLSFAALTVFLIINFFSIFLHNLLLPISLMFGFLSILMYIKVMALSILRAIIKGAKK